MSGYEGYPGGGAEGMYSNVQQMRRKDQGNPAMVILLTVLGVLVTFLVGNIVLYYYAQKKFPSKKKKPLTKKQMQRNKLKQGLQMPSD